MVKKRQGERRRDRKCIICGADPGWRCVDTRMKYNRTPLLRDHKER